MKTNGAGLIFLKSGNEESALLRNGILLHLDERRLLVSPIRTVAWLSFSSAKNSHVCRLVDMCIILVILNKVTRGNGYSGETC